MLLFPKKIITGGQTGADIGGLIAARELGIESGGTAPKGWLTENGTEEALLRSFGLEECEEAGFPARTRRNIVDSTGTILVGRYQSGGSRLTYDVVKELKKPLFLVAFPSAGHCSEEFRNWLAAEEIRVLNVAGNRESQSPGIAEFTRSFLVRAIKRKMR
jgi:hypothetical protein